MLHRIPPTKAYNLDRALVLNIGGSLSSRQHRAVAVKKNRVHYLKVSVFNLDYHRLRMLVFRQSKYVIRVF